MKKTIYTCLVGNYESLLQPEVVDEEFDYICFSNDIKTSEVGVWKIKPIPYEYKDLVRMSRYVKLLPHKVLEEYDYSIWMDANIEIVGKEFYDYVNKRIKEEQLITQVPHLKSSTVYDEIKNAYYGEKISLRDAKEQMLYLKEQGITEDIGMLENNIILRKHLDPFVIKLDEAWWYEFSKFPFRDQFWLPFVYWKNNFWPSYLIDNKHNSRNVDCLKYIVHPSMQIRNDFYHKHKVLRAINAFRKKIGVWLLSL